MLSIAGGKDTAGDRDRGERGQGMRAVERGMRDAHEVNDTRVQDAHAVKNTKSSFDLRQPIPPS